MHLETISEEYKQANKHLHEQPRGFGGDGHKWIDKIAAFSQVIGAKTLLDYGAGQQLLEKGINEKHADLFSKVVSYDPARPNIKEKPVEFFDLVSCTDVLEHIEPIYIDNVLKELFHFAKKGLFLNIAIKPANKILPDGRNAHLIVEHPDWWVKKLIEHSPYGMDIVTEYVTSKTGMEIDGKIVKSVTFMIRF